MPVSVRDCLELPIFKGAEVVGGASGLDNVVKTLTVLETCNFNEMVTGLVQGNEIVITSFFDARNDIQKQCNLLKILKGEAAIVLFYVGIVMPKIHPDLINTADEIGLPLICMPTKTPDLRYSDMISAVMELVIGDKVNSAQLMDEIIFKFSKVDSKQQSLQYAMQLISEKLDCGLILFDSSLSPLLLSNVSDDMYYALETELKKPFHQAAFLNQKYSKFNFCLDKNNCIGYGVSLKTEKHLQTYLYIVDHKNNINNNNILGQIAESIKLCATIWRYNPVEEAESRLVQAILNKDRVLVNLHAKRLNISASEIYGLIQIRPKLYSQYIKELHTIALNLKRKLEILPIRVLVYERQNSIEIILLKKKETNSMESPVLFGEITGILNNLIIPESNMVAIFVMDITDIEQLYHEYSLIEKIGDAALLVYPHKIIFSKYNLRFAEHCLELSRTNNTESNNFRELIKPLMAYDSKHSNYMIDTLAVFLLDTDLNTKQTAATLFLHPNTVQYRIKKIENILGDNITNTPLMLMLSISLGIYRISKYSDNTKD